MSKLVLSLFPGIGLLDMAFEEAGFCVVRGPDLLWGGDVRRFHPPAGRFDGVIGGPPCQAFSTLRHMIVASGKQLSPNLIPEYERVVAEAAPSWFLMENVRDAPIPVVGGYLVRDTLLRDAWVGGITNRLRRFSFGSRDGRALAPDTLALHIADPEPAAMAAGGLREVPVRIGGSGKVKRTFPTVDKRTNDGYADHLRKQGLPGDYLAGAPFTVAGKIKMIGNGVPLPMGRAVARAVVRAMRLDLDAA